MYHLLRPLAFAVVAISVPLSGCADLAGLGSPSSLEKFGSLTAALAFEAAPNSGVKAHGLSMWLTTPATAGQIGGALRQIGHPDLKIDSFVSDHCSPPDPHAVMKLEAVGAIAGPLLVSWGQWAYNLVVGELEGRIAKLKKASDPPAYAFKQVVEVRGNSAGFWNDITCVVVHRSTKGDKSKPENAAGMTAIIRKESKGAHASTFKLIYLRLDNSIAITGIGTAEAPPEVQVTVAFSVSGARKAKGIHVVEEMTHLDFKPVSAPLGGKAPAAEVCPPATPGARNPNAKACKWESDLIPNPFPGTTALAISIAVKETGSAADVADKASDGLKALNAITKPSFETWLKKAAADATK